MAFLELHQCLVPGFIQAKLFNWVFIYFIFCSYTGILLFCVLQNSEYSSQICLGIVPCVRASHVYTVVLGAILSFTYLTSHIISVFWPVSVPFLLLHFTRMSCLSFLSSCMVVPRPWCISRCLWGLVCCVYSICCCRMHLYQAVPKLLMGSICQSRLLVHLKSTQLERYILPFFWKF